MFTLLLLCTVYQVNAVSNVKNEKKDKSPFSFTANDFFYDTKGKKCAKETNKTWKIGKNAHVTKEYNFNYGSTLAKYNH